MGMIKDSSRGFSKGVELLTDVVEFAGLQEKVKISRDGEYDAEAGMKELDALNEASEHRWKASEEARLSHEEMEQDRSKARADWGQSGVALSGSRQMVLDGQRERDRRIEANQELEDDLKEKSILNKGLREANKYRIAMGRSPKTTLSLGSTIYKNRG